jgi:hypothetical protein
MEAIAGIEYTKDVAGKNVMFKLTWICMAIN